MDNICHTLVGAALAESGLKRRTALGTATLMIAANFPDIDVIAVPLGHGLGFRRGMTHGVAALVILPFALTGLMMLWHRLRRHGAPDPKPGALLLLSAIGILTHPFLDWMNTYGMRWLMPLDPSWSYADTLFIVDPWILLALGWGVWLSRRRQRHGLQVFSMLPARFAITLVVAYIAAMGAVTLRARTVARASLESRGITPDVIVVDPVFADATRRRVIYQWNGAWHLASMRVIPTASLAAPSLTIPLNGDHPAVASASATAAGREYHSWSRLPYYVIEEGPDTTWVLMGDARYTFDARSSWAAVRIPVPRQATTALPGPH